MMIREGKGVKRTLLAIWENVMGPGKYRDLVTRILKRLCVELAACQLNNKRLERCLRLFCYKIGEHRL